ncbi:hypothetical protein OH807_19340 [Kitasatospora sp. NBC_01560]|uniref:hypothetical protein n=1 Tax=Kitasatospora sp. NBC_01560 TaxID=2975965 RepID=UPI0038664FAB
MTDPNHVNAGPDGRPQHPYPHPQAQPGHPQAAPGPYGPSGSGPYGPGAQQGPPAQPYEQRQPYGQQPQHGQQPYEQQPLYGQQPQPGQPPYGQQPGYGRQAPYGQPSYPQPPVDDAATALLPPVPPMDDAATALLPPVVVSGAMPTAAPVPGPAPAGPAGPAGPAAPPAPARHAGRPAAQAPVQDFDPPTMTLKRPVPPRPGVPAQSAPSAASAAPAAPRTGSPIIDPGLQPALITAGAAALLAGGAALGQVALALVVVLLQGLTAAGWFRLNGMWPARQGIALAALAGFTADAAVLLADSDGGAAAVVGTLGGFFLLVLVLQTFRPSDPKERFYALTVLGSATVVTVLCTALLLADWVPAAVGAVALATVLAAAPLPGPKLLGPVLGLAAAVVFGLVVGAPLALGALAGLGALVGRRVAGYDFPSRFVHMTAGVALPLAVASPLIWIATRLLAG